MQEIAQQVIDYIRINPVLAAAIALVCGMAAVKSVRREGRGGLLLYVVVGIIGLFLGQFVLLYFGLQQYLEKIAQFQILFDVITAYIGAFVVAAILHFVSPL